MAHAEIWFPHGPCRNLISTWPMKKSFKLLQFDEFLSFFLQNFIKHSTCVLKFVKMKQEFHVKQKFCLVNSYRNTISKWALGFRYRNFFIPRVEKNLKISPWEGNSNLPRAYGPWEDRVSSLGLIFGGFFNPWDEEISIPETRPIRKTHIFLYESIYAMTIEKFLYLYTLFETENERQK